MIERKIAFIGTSCSGKTTLINSLKKIYKDNRIIGFVPEAARMLFSSYKPTQRFSVEMQARIQDLAYANEIDMAKLGEARILVCDTCVVDCAAYTRAHAGVEAGDRIFNRYAHWLPTYTKFFLLNPKEVPFENDDIRTESYEDREKVYKSFLELLDEKRIEYELLCGSKTERVQRVRKELRV